MKYYRVKYNGTYLNKNVASTVADLLDDAATAFEERYGMTNTHLGFEVVEEELENAYYKFKVPYLVLTTPESVLCKSPHLNEVEFIGICAKKLDFMRKDYIEICVSEDDKVKAVQMAKEWMVGFLKRSETRWNIIE